jgi:hypothetical protein
MFEAMSGRGLVLLASLSAARARSRALAGDAAPQTQLRVADEVRVAELERALTCVHGPARSYVAGCVVRRVGASDGGCPGEPRGGMT